MNNKGQTLILFVIIVPVFLLLLVLVIDIGKMIVRRLELDNISEIVLDCGIDKLGEENISDDILNLVKLNDKNIDKIDIDIIGDKIYLSLSDTSNFMFKRLLPSINFSIQSNYVGYVVDGKKKIERVGE